MFLFHVQGEAVNALYGALKAKSLNSCPGEITARFHQQQATHSEKETEKNSAPLK